jgi:hypothetical protein
MINLVSTVKRRGKVCEKCLITFYKVQTSCDLYDNPAADINEVQKVEQEQYDSSHVAENAGVSNVGIKILKLS